VGGHYASPDRGIPFHAYLAGGPADDHEGTREEDAVARARQGMRSMLRLGSAWYDVESQITAVTERGLDPRNFILCTDDCHSGTLVHEGHMDRVVRHAIAVGCDPLVALQMATVNTATHFGLERELGSIAPGRRADLILTSSLEDLPIEAVFARGVKVAEEGKAPRRLPPSRLARGRPPDGAPGQAAGGLGFRRPAPDSARPGPRPVIGVVENQAPTTALSADLPVRGGVVEPEGEVAHIALVERHRATGGVTNAFRVGLRLPRPHGARLDGRPRLPPHDRGGHRPRADGARRQPPGRARRRRHPLARRRGGRLRAAPIAGLMSDAPAREVAAKAQALGEAMAEAGCRLNNAYMQHSLLALVVIPELRLSDKGLVDVRRFEVVSLFEGNE
jgi:adenine deaminase